MNIRDWAHPLITVFICDVQSIITAVLMDFFVTPAQEHLENKIAWLNCFTIRYVCLVCPSVTSSTRLWKTDVPAAWQTADSIRDEEDNMWQQAQEIKSACSAHQLLLKNTTKTGHFLVCDDRWEDWYVSGNYVAMDQNVC